MARDLFEEAGISGPQGRDLFAEAGLNVQQPSFAELLKREVLRSPFMQAPLGMLRGAGDIGATGMRLFESGDENQKRRDDMTAGLVELGADPSSGWFKAGRIGGNVAGTAGLGPLLGRAALGLNAPAPVATALTTGGMSSGNLAGAGGAAARALAGGTVGFGSAGMIDPESAKSGGLIGAAAPSVVRGAAQVGRAAGRGIGEASDAVVDLARTARDKWRINIPADRISNSNVLKQAGDSLNYVPLSGRAAAETNMKQQLFRAVSWTMGEDTPNLAAAVKRAQANLGAKFDSTLKNNRILFDQQLLDDMARVSNEASDELTSQQFPIIDRQVRSIVDKAATGSIDGQAGYNIKKVLDRLGNGQDSSLAYHARQLKRVLMDALNRSLPEDVAREFGKVRTQYGNLLDVEGLVLNGADAGLSPARFAATKGLRGDLKELADISAQFIKSPESQHSAQQRAWAMMGLLSGSGLALGGPTGAAITAAAQPVLARTGNAMLNSQWLNNALLQQQLSPMLTQDATQALLRTAPLLPTFSGR